MIETGVSFGDLHSFYDLDLILADVSIPPASPKTTYVEIPGADGSVDLTEAHGEVKYSDRTGAKFTFYMNPAGDLSEFAWEEKKKQISNLLNGLRCNITVDKDPDYYWQGRCTVNEHSCNKKLRKFVVGARLAPYKLKTNVTSVFVPFCGKNLLRIPKSKTTISQGVTWATTDDGRITANGTPTAYSALAIYGYNDGFILGKGTYALSFSGTCENVNVDVAITKADGTKATIVSSKAMPIVFTMPETASVYLAVKRRLDNSQINMDCFLQIEAGSKVTDFEAYTPNADPVEITLTNARKRVCPSIVVTEEATVTFSGGESTLGAGTHKILDLQLHKGETPVTVSGTGAVTFIYQEGDL